jgi:hypothetical protein
MTKALVKLENYCLPQFSMKWKITSMLHLFAKHPSDHYDFIIGHDIQSEIELDILYSSKQIAWNDIMFDMVPKRHLNRIEIKKIWQVKRKKLILLRSCQQNIKY